MLKTVDRVEDEDAASPTQDKLTGFGKHPFRSGAAFEGDVTDVFGKKLFRTEQKSFRHAATVLSIPPHRGNRKRSIFPIS